MSEHIACLKEKDWGKLWEIVRKVTEHVEEGEKNGGFRDRMLRAELDIKALKERFWQSSLIGGVIGALIGTGSKDILLALIKWITNK